MGGNRGRGQVYPDGSKVIILFIMHPAAGKIIDITPEREKGGFGITIEKAKWGTICRKNP